MCLISMMMKMYWTVSMKLGIARYVWHCVSNRIDVQTVISSSSSSHSWASSAQHPAHRLSPSWWSQPATDTNTHQIMRTKRSISMTKMHKENNDGPARVVTRVDRNNTPIRHDQRTLLEVDLGLNSTPRTLPFFPAAVNTPHIRPRPRLPLPLPDAPIPAYRSE